MITRYALLLGLLAACTDQPGRAPETPASDTAPPLELPSPELRSAAGPAIASVDTTVTVRWDTVALGDSVRQAQRSTVVTITSRSTTIDSTIVIWRQPPPMTAGIGVGAYLPGSAFATGVPAPLTMGVGPTSPSSLPNELALARQKKQRRAVFLPDGSHCPILTPVCVNGQPQSSSRFDLAKWKSRFRAFATPAVKSAIAQAVGDGTLVGVYLLDEPSNKDWNGSFTAKVGDGGQGITDKGHALLEAMAQYADSIFPGLPTIVVGYAQLLKVDSLPPFQHVDAFASQYDWWQGRSGRVVGSCATQAGITEVQRVRCWRDTMTAASRRKNVAVLFQMNVINGGIQPVNGVCPSSSGGKGTTGCRLTAAQLRDWGKELLTGCAFALWKHDPMLQKAEYITALREIIALAATRPQTPCT
jgi:hypothetical protein